MPRLNLLTAFLRMHEQAGLLGKRPQRHDDKPGTVVARATRQTGHTFTAKPDDIAFKKRLQFRFLFPLNQIQHFTRIVIVKLGGRTDGRTGTAVHAHFHAFLKAHILQELFV